MKKKNKTILISGGGTGGHIFPAIAIAQEINRISPDISIVFVGALGKMEMDKVPKAGFPIIGLPVSGFHRRLTYKNLSFPFKLVASMWKAAAIIRKYKPVVVIGTGGYASGPILKAANRKGIPTIIQEQNAFPGVTNRLLAQKAQHICVAHEGLEQWFPEDKIRLTGNPVRKDLTELTDKKQEAVAYYKMDAKQTNLLIFGGSLGALAINQGVEKQVKELCSLNIGVLWQTGINYYNQAQALVAELGVGNQIKVLPFLDRMDLAFALADVVVCRAGAITLSELCLAQKPNILVPYPSAAGDHQRKNAWSFRDQKASVVVENQEVGEALLPVLKNLLADVDLQNEMKQSLAKMAKPQAGENIAKLVMELVNEREV